MQVITSLGPWFHQRLAGVKCRPETIAYIAGVLKDQSRVSQATLANCSLVLEYQQARNTGSFVGFQRVGDWVLFADVCMPESLIERELAETVARKAYYTCYRLMGSSWDIYEELADGFTTITTQARQRLLAP
jgi:hypothetical protein